MVANPKEEMGRLKGLDANRRYTSNQKRTLTDPEARSLAIPGRGLGVVGHNLQAAVDTEHHPITTHEVTNVENDNAQFARISR